MASEWYITILNDPQGFWKLPQHYLTAPFTGSTTDTVILSDVLDAQLNHLLWLVVIVPFTLLLGGSLPTSGITIANETRRTYFRGRRDAWRLYGRRFGLLYGQ